MRLPGLRQLAWMYALKRVEILESIPTPKHAHSSVWPGPVNRMPLKQALFIFSEGLSPFIL